MVSNFYQNTPVIRFTSNEYRIVSVLVSFINSYFWYQDYIIPEVQKFLWLDLCDPLHFQHNHLRQLGDPFNTNTNCFFCLINHVKGFQSLLKTPVIRLTANEYKICLCTVFYKYLLISVIRTILISLINAEVGINVEGVQKLPNH